MNYDLIVFEAVDCNFISEHLQKFFLNIFIELRNVNSTLTTKDAKDRLTELTIKVSRSF